MAAKRRVVAAIPCFKVDTSQAILTAGAVESQHKLVTTQPYGNGYGDQVLLAFVSEVSGVSVQALDTVFFPFLGCLAILAAIALMRAVFGTSDVRAPLAVLILIVQPEFLFTVLRGNHEKFTLTLAIVCLLLFVRSQRFVSRPAAFATLIVLFYACLFALVTYNVFFASAFTLAMVGGLLAFRVLLLRIGPLRAHLNATMAGYSSALGRLSIVATTGAIFVYLFFANLYPPARAFLYALQDVYTKVFALALDVQGAADPYSTINFGWRSPLLYVVLTLATWLTLAGAVAGWLAYARRLLVGGDDVSFARTLLWLLFIGFGLQAVASILSDFAGALDASNLQLRLLPLFVIVGVPFAADAVVGLWTFTARFGGRQALIGGAVFASFCWFAVAGLLKGTAEPTLSTYWIFYTPAEQQSVRWFDAHASNAGLWTDFDNRLVEARTAWTSPGVKLTNSLDRDTLEPSTGYVLVSDVVLARADRIRRPLPIVTASEDRIYDAGTAIVYHLKPRTPYQR